MCRNRLCGIILWTLFYVVEPRRSESIFPDGFMFGVETSAYQIEGAWNLDGKGESIWDYNLHMNSSYVEDESNGDVACDSYNRYEEDVQMLRFLGVNYYKFSISWSRLFPNGHVNVINKQGLAYYNNLINELLKYNITPCVTLYHWDLPQTFQEYGGWANKLLVDKFDDYARVIFEKFGDRVKLWITFDGIHQFCREFVKMKGFLEYPCVHTTLLAHAKAYHLYDKVFRKSQNGRIGMSIITALNKPASDEKLDIYAAQTYTLFQTAMIADPIFSANGDYPTKIKYKISDRTWDVGFDYHINSRLPNFTKEDIDFVKGTADFYGLSHHTTNVITRWKYSDADLYEACYESDVGGYTVSSTKCPHASTESVKTDPEDIRNVLNWVKDRYDNPEILLFGIGYSYQDELNDLERVEFQRAYLEAVLDAMDDGCNVSHYWARSLMDAFEWAAGYSEKLGLFHVDFNDPDRTRTPKASAHVYKEIIRTNNIDWDYKPDI